MIFRRKPRVDGFVGLTMTPERASIARVVTKGTKRPRLELLETLHRSGEGSLTKALTELVKRHRLANAPCSIVLEPGSYSLMQVEAPEVAADEMKAAVRWRIKDLLDFDIKDAIIDVFEIPVQSRPDSPKLIYAVAAYAPFIQPLIDQVTASGLRLITIDITELALRNITNLLPEEGGEGLATLHLGESYSLINLGKQSSVYLTRSIGVDINQLQFAEQSLGGDTGLEQADTAIVDELILEIQRSMNYYESYFSLPPIRSLAITPTSPELPGVTHYLNSHLGVPSRPLDLNRLMDVYKPLDLSQQVQGLLAVGGALRNAGGKT